MPVPPVPASILQAQQAAKQTTAAPAAAAAGGRVVATPFAKKLASEQNVDLTQVSGSGPGGRILAIDVTSSAASVGAPSPRVQG
jgi:pyruvate/2-oxoglutarate dehydrogenase complex dihydrolipoamide acyltransferase (E2) component